MRRILGAISAGLVLAGLVMGGASAAPKKQTVEGTILFPARHPDGCYTGLQRHLTSVIGEPSNGVVGWNIKVDKRTWKKPFILDGMAGAGTLDLDITFYMGEFHTQEEFINDPAPVAPFSVAFETRGQPGEKGKVPEGAINAIVCIYADEAAQALAAGVDFTYTAGKGVK